MLKINTKNPKMLMQFLKFADDNFQIIRKLVEDVGNLFENANQSMVPKSHNNRYEDEDIRVRLQDMDKVRPKIISVLHTPYLCVFAIAASDLIECALNPLSRSK